MFKIGDKVTHETYGNGEVTHTEVCTVSFKGFGIYNVNVSELKAVPKYSIGQTVTLYKEQYTILSDVFVDSDGHRSYVARDSEGDCQFVPESDIKD